MWVLVQIFNFIDFSFHLIKYVGIFLLIIKISNY